MELLDVSTDWQVANIFTKSLGLDKLRQFSGALGVQYLDMPNLRGRNESRNEKYDRKAESKTDFDFGSTEEVGVRRSTEEAETGCKGSHRNGKPKPEPTEKMGCKAKKAKKTNRWAWYDVVQGLKTEEEFVTTNSEKSLNESESPISEDMLDSEERDQLKAKGTRR